MKRKTYRDLQDDNQFLRLEVEKQKAIAQQAQDLKSQAQNRFDDLNGQIKWFKAMCERLTEMLMIEIKPR